TKQGQKSGKATTLEEASGGKISGIELTGEVKKLYCDGVLVSQTDSEFILTFLQSRQPLSAPALCIGQLVFSPAHMERLVEILTERLTQFKEERNASDDQES